MARSKPDRRTGQLFRSLSGQDELFEKSYEEELEARRGQPVECLGMTFESGRGAAGVLPGKVEGEASRTSATARLPGRRGRGHPAAVGPAVLHRLPQSVPGRVRQCHGRPYDSAEPYHREPFAVDVSEGKTDPALQGTRLSHQGAASGNRPVHPALHEAGRYRPGRLLRFRHDRRGGPVVRHGVTGIPPTN